MKREEVTVDGRVFVAPIPPSDGGDIAAILDHLADQMDEASHHGAVPTVLADGCHIPPARVRFLAGVVRHRTDRRH